MTVNRIVDAKENDGPCDAVSQRAGKAGTEYRLVRLGSLGNPILRRKVDIHVGH